MNTNKHVNESLWDRLPACRNIGEKYFDAVVIAGPTAVGKTEISVLVAEALNAEIISMDSRMVYCGLDVAAAKPSEDERGGVPHHLIDIVEPGERFTTADFTTMCGEAIASVRVRGRLPLIVGGTFLYLNAMMSGFNFCGANRDPEVRRGLEEEARERGTAALHAELAKADPESASRIHHNDRYRIFRALEVLRITGAPPSTRRGIAKVAPPNLLIVTLYLPKNILYERINKRTISMYNSGLKEETVNILKARPEARDFLLNVIGCAQTVDFIEGRKTLEEAVEDTKRETRRFARRQMIWLRRMSGLSWINLEGKNSPGAAREIAEYIAAKCAPTE